MKIISVATALILATSALARDERSYAIEWAREAEGKVEVRLPDGSRCDVVTATHAIEVEFAPKWQEAIGQALFYSVQTNKKPGIVLVIRSPKENTYLLRLNTTINAFALPIDVWTIRDEGSD